MLQGGLSVLPSDLIVENLIFFPIVIRLAMRAKSHATEKRIWIRVKENEEIKEAAITARNGPRMVVVVEVVVTKTMIIQIMETEAFR